MIASFERAALAFATVTLTMHASIARADGASDPTEKTQAERLFLRGKDLLESGKTDAACVAFEESLRLDRAGGTLLNLAECYVAEKRIASAERTLRDAKALAESAHRDDAAAFADQRLGEIAPLVSTVTILASDAPPQLTLTIDDQPVSAGTAVELDSGAHTLEASAPTYAPFALKFDVDGDAVHLGLHVPALRSTVAKEAPAPHGASAQRIAGLVATAAGGAITIIGAGLGIGAAIEWKQASSRCPQTICHDKSAVDDAEQSGKLADGASVGLAVGLAAAALGVTLLLTEPSTHPKRAAALRVDLGGVSLRGSF